MCREIAVDVDPLQYPKACLADRLKAENRPLTTEEAFTLQEAYVASEVPFPVIYYMPADQRREFLRQIGRLFG